MRYVYKLMLLAVFTVAVSMVGCGDSATKDTKAKDETKTEKKADNKADSDTASNDAAKSPEAEVSKVSFNVTGMS